MLRIADAGEYSYAPVEAIGHEYMNTTYNRHHIDAVLALPAVDVEAIRNAHFRVAVDAVNSVGGTVIPQLLRALGVSEIVELNCEPTGHLATG